MSAKEYNLDKKFKLVAPDGGWAYMIAFAVVLNFATTTMFQGSFDIIYKGFIKEIGMSSTQMTMMFGIATICTSVSAFLTAPLLSIINTRLLSFVAVILFDMGVFGTMFANSVFPCIVLVGILQGTGCGLLYNLSYTMLVDYFVEKRLIIIGITHTLIALPVVLAPMLSKWLMEEYGYRGTILVISGITLNNLIAVVITQPVTRHMKKVEILESEMSTIIVNESDKSLITPVIKLNDIEANASKINLCGDTEYKTTNALKLIRLFQMGKNTDIPDSGFACKIGEKKFIDFLFDKSLRKTFMISCASLGPALSVFSDSTYIDMLPESLYAANWNQHDVNLATSVIRFGDIAMRIGLIFCTKWIVKLGSEECYILGILVALVARLGALWSISLIWNLIYITLAGLAHCSIVLLLPVVIADVVSPHQFSAAIGYCMLMKGVINLILGPAIDAVRDLSDSYGAAFYLLASCFAIVALFWLIEICYKRNLQKRIQRREYLKQKKLNRG